MVNVKSTIQKMNPYSPPLEGRASEGYLLLDFNEMTIEPSPKVKRALKEFVDSGRIQVYPEYGDLDKVIAKYVGCEAGEVLVTNGSDQAIEVILRTFLEKGDKIVIPSPSFAMFYQSAQVQGAEIITPHYTKENLDFPLTEVLNLLEQRPTCLILCNPNNPTGTAITKEDVHKMLEKAKENNVVVLHDEAYFEFSGITAKDFIQEFDNLFITRTFSKQFGLAALRIGYVISQKKNIEELRKIRGPYDVNMFAKTAVVAALDDIDYARKYATEVMEEAKPRVEAFFREHHIKFYESSANFLLIEPKDSEKTFEVLKAKGIVVRPRKDLPGTIRISIGTLNDTERFIQAYSSLLG